MKMVRTWYYMYMYPVVSFYLSFLLVLIVEFEFDSYVVNEGDSIPVCVVITQGSVGLGCYVNLYIRSEITNNG